MKKAFTLIELTIAIALLGTIILAVFSLFMVASRNYRVQSQKSYLQKELNFTADALANEMKLSHNVLSESQGKTLGLENLIMSLPAIDSEGNFVYTGGILEYDTIIYAKENGSLRKIVIPAPNSSRVEKNFIVLTDVSLVNFSYEPDNINPLSITGKIEVNRNVGKNNIKVAAERSAFLRNK